MFAKEKEPLYFPFVEPIAFHNIIHFVFQGLLPERTLSPIVLAATYNAAIYFRLPVLAEHILNMFCSNEFLRDGIYRDVSIAAAETVLMTHPKHEHTTGKLRTVLIKLDDLCKSEPYQGPGPDFDDPLLPELAGVVQERIDDTAEDYVTVEVEQSPQARSDCQGRADYGQNSGSSFRPGKRKAARSETEEAASLSRAKRVRLEDDIAGSVYELEAHRIRASLTAEEQEEFLSALTPTPYKPKPNKSSQVVRKTVKDYKERKGQSKEAAKTRKNRSAEPRKETKQEKEARAIETEKQEKQARLQHQNSARDARRLRRAAAVDKNLAAASGLTINAIRHLTKNRSKSSRRTKANGKQVHSLEANA